MSTTEKALKAVAEAETLRQAAIRELLDVIKGAEKHLTELGYKAIPVNNAGKRTKTRNTDPANRFCEFCQMKGHDGRAHRGQGKKKKKRFNAVELKTLGLA